MLINVATIPELMGVQVHSDGVTLGVSLSLTEVDDILRTQIDENSGYNVNLTT